MKRLVYILLFFVGSLSAQQFARPISDITALGANGVGTYTNIDEVVVSNSDYISSNDNVSVTYEVELGNLVDPLSSVGHFVRYYQAQADGNVAPSSGGTASTYSAYLYQGATLIATMASGATSSNVFTLTAFQLSGAQADAITDYTDLRIRFDFVGGGGSPSARRGVAVGWVEMSVPYLVNNITVAQNTADATAFGTDNTPTLEFTGTDNDASNTLEYNVDIMSSYNTNVDNFSTGQDNYNAIGSPNVGGFYYLGVGQTFTGNGTKLYSAEFYLLKTGSPTGYMRAELYAITGTSGTNATPTGEPLAISTPVDASTVTGSYTFIPFYFDGSYTLVNSTDYAINFQYSSGTDANYIRVGVDNSSPTDNGNIFRSGFEDTWSTLSSDNLFKINSSVGVLLKNSESDSGFVNTVDGGDTHPFTEAQKIGFTVQNADYLADGTYYWRSQAKAPSSANLYSTWSGVRSFTVTGGSPPAASTKRVFIIN